MAFIIVTPNLRDRIASKQKEDMRLARIMRAISENVTPEHKQDFETDHQGVLRVNGRLCILNFEGIRQEVLAKCHHSKLSIHLGVTKIYHDMKRVIGGRAGYFDTHWQM